MRTIASGTPSATPIASTNPGLVLAQTAVDRRPSSVAHEFLGNELLLAGNREAGVQELRKAVPGAPRAYVILAVALAADGRLDEAIDDLRIFLREQSMLLEAVEARLVLAQLLDKQQRWTEAIEQYDMMLHMNPTRGQQERALLRLGIDLVVTENLPRAIEVFSRAVQIDPDSEEAVRDLANALFDHKEFDAAGVHARRALELRPDDAQVHDLLGKVLATRGHFAEARSEFERALAIEPSREDAREDLPRIQPFLQ